MTPLQLIGPLKEWENAIEFAGLCNYNMVHFTPLQQLGWSNSAYCITDQLAIDKRYEADKSQVSDFIQKMRSQYKIMSCADLVFNHMASDSEWLIQHPGATFNLLNSPHLIPAFLLDREIIHINQEIIDGKHPTLVEITNEAILSDLGDLLRRRFKSLRLEEFRQCNVQEQLERFKGSVEIFAVRTIISSQEPFKRASRVYKTGKSEAD